MFAKPIRVKGNTSLKNSEKKNLAQKIQTYFPRITDDDAKTLLPIKSTCCCMKIVTHSEMTIAVYTVDNIPVMIEAWDKMFPTIFAHWKCPNMLPTIAIHKQIVKKLQNGAPLFLPGVEIPYHGLGFPEFSIGQVIGVSTDDNRAAVMIGTALMSSGDMLLKSSGTCVETIQILGDYLCKEVKSVKVERPHINPLSKQPSLISTENLTETLQMVSIISNQTQKESWPSLGPKPRDQIPVAVHQDDTSKNTTTQNPYESPITAEVHPNAADVDDYEDSNNGNDEDDGIPSDMDSLLKYCLLSFLKLEGKRIIFPLKTNLLYRNHMVPLCPAGRSLDVKKSSYKKMGKFLDAMEKDGILMCKEIDKGVDALVGVDLTHPDIRRHVILGVPTIQDEVSKENEVEPSFVAPTIKEMYSVTAAVLSFLPLKKGTAVTASEVRRYLTDYVKKHNLQDLDKSRVNPDGILALIVGTDAPQTWEQLMNGVMNKMSFCNEIMFPDGTVKIIKGKLDLIQMQVVTRSGNKKATIVSNLESYGIDLATLSKECQHGVAASCTITRTAGAKHDQLMVQGNQTYFLAKHLTENYGIPKKYIDGADKALKKKK